MLMLALAACGGSGMSRTAETPSINSQPIPSSSAGSSEPTGTSSEPPPLEPVESGERASSSSIESSESMEAVSVENDIAGRRIQITTEEGGETVFQLNESPAAISFYNQLPLSIEVEDFGGSEKIFYPPDELETDNAPLAQGPAGTLAYYAPWGNVAVFYGECGGSSGLYALGEAVAGVELIPAMTGEVRIEAVGAPSVSGGSAGTAMAASQQTQLPASIESPAARESANEISSEESMTMKMNLQIGNRTFTAALEENAAADALVELMKAAPLTIQMSDYGGFEKVGSLGTSLPAGNSQTTTQSGDIVLYNGNQIVIFYGSNSWSYTRLGKIDDLTGWEEALGNGDVSVTFSAVT